MLDSPSHSSSSRLLDVNKESHITRESHLKGNHTLHDGSKSQTSRHHSRRKVIIGLVAVAVIAIFLVVFLPVFFIVIRKNDSRRTGGSGVPNPNSPSGAITGGDGSIIKLDNGTTFTYRNPFGGFWVQDPGDPFNNNARPNSWTPPLNSRWQWGKDRVYGVNLGGLFVLEPFITPSLFQQYPDAKDEYTLSQAMAADQTNGGLNQLENHYNTFITEQDIAEIAGAGLNFLRIPLAFWAIETWEDEPYLAKTSWKYFLRVLGWARKYGLRVCLDLHAVPGSQNGFNHSGKLSPVNFLAGNMGLANAQRTLYYLRVITEFISQPEYQELIPIFGIVNEALVGTIGVDSITSFYLEAHNLIRNITGSGEGNGPYIAIHDGFQPQTMWYNFLQGSDRIILDQHPYFSFGGPQTAPIGVVGDQGIPGGQWPLTACNVWGPTTNTTRANFGVMIAGEFSASPNDCGFWLLGVGSQSSNPVCPEFDAWETYNDTMKQGIQNFVSASMDAFGDWFFWTWKIGPTEAGRIETPLWSYQLGLKNGWISKDPRSASGLCASIGSQTENFNNSYQPWQTGTPSSIPASSTSSFPWPPTTISGAGVSINLLPTYTDTAPIITLPPATFTAAPSSITAPANGWFNMQDTEGGITTVDGCPYPSEYDGIFSVVPTAPCTGPVSAPSSVI
ncbi:putative glucan 1,3-beta-glucosidase D [Psilocybe cubensis]|uniref:Glucan 1,3-beta-glucosidase D n=2 Tax=Psilocybe cubensis TaxID=181762 RepID=A0ACB8H9S4_PSICU|nr:putative glucan 1,3-beta-glucosidase D [Psilocybe cubensis]KAH9484569.1 putative glucan 1,3-beta-glucosidase D [Psilocybe cubensis]